MSPRSGTRPEEIWSIRSLWLWPWLGNDSTHGPITGLGAGAVLHHLRLAGCELSAESCGHVDDLRATEDVGAAVRACASALELTAIGDDAIRDYGEPGTRPSQVNSHLSRGGPHHWRLSKRRQRDTRHDSTGDLELAPSRSSGA